MGRVVLREIVSHCATYDEGKVVFDIIKDILANGEKVSVSFEGMTSVSTSFVNAAFIELLGVMSFNDIKANLSFTETNRFINDTIKRRFAFEVQRLKQAVA